MLINNANELRKLNLQDPALTPCDVPWEIESNLTGPIQMVQQFLPHLLTQPTAAILKVINISKAQMGVEQLDLKQAAKVPVIFGEKDILKTLTLLPGIKTAGESSSSISVRGGAVDQNLLLLDEEPIYNASHLLGFFSTFYSDAIREVTVFKGGMPAQYGGRLSSVVDVRMQDGNNQALHGSGGIGLIASRLALEGPIVKGKGSFLVTGRRTYVDPFLKLSSNSAVNSSSLYFYDLNAKANYALSDRNKLYFSAYLGRDALAMSGSTTATGRSRCASTTCSAIGVFANNYLIYRKLRLPD